MMIFTDKPDIDAAVSRWHDDGHPTWTAGPGQFAEMTVADLIYQLTQLPSNLPVRFGTQYFPPAQRLALLEFDREGRTCLCVVVTNEHLEGEPLHGATH